MGGTRRWRHLAAYALLLATIAPFTLAQAADHARSQPLSDSEVKFAVRGCWDLAPWPEKLRRMKADPMYTWTISLCFQNRAGTVEYAVFEGSGTFDGVTAMGDYGVSGGRLFMHFPGDGLMELANSSCEIGLEERGHLKLLNCIEWTPAPGGGMSDLKKIDDRDFVIAGS